MQENNSRFRNNAKEIEDKHRINDEIRAKEVRVISDKGDQLGVISLAEALRLAEDQGLDLVEVAPQASPPVCRILDYGKLRYREQKRTAEARKKGATQGIKEIRLRYNTNPHDLETKLRNAQKFLAEGDKVRFSMRFKGREAVYSELGEQIFNQIVQVLEAVAVVEERTPLIGQRMLLTVNPRS